MGETVFFRLLEAEDKAASLEEEIARFDALATNEAEKSSARAFSVEPAAFRQVPGSPFAYWASDEVRALFQKLRPFEAEGRTVKQGLATADDFRFVRLWWEVAAIQLGSEVRWFPFAKGGSYSPFYADVLLVVGYSRGDQVGLMAIGRYGRGATHYFRPGLTWPLRTNGLSVRVMPRGCIFGHKGPAAFVESDETEMLLALCGVLCSRVFRQLVAVQLARTELAQSFEVGLIQQTPVPTLDKATALRLSQLLREAWLIRFASDSVVEISHAFVRPALLQFGGVGVRSRVNAWEGKECHATSRFAELQAQIDAEALRLYEISEESLQSSEPSGSTTTDDVGEEELESEETSDFVDAGQHVAMLLSYAVGACFGRWDLRKDVVDSRSKAEPFEPLPVCSPGMLQGSEGLPLEKTPEDYPLSVALNGILVDDPGHPSDISAAVRRVFEVLFPRESEACWQETGELLGIARGKPEEWLRKEFFAFHIQQYSRSRRKAPIYWQLATPSARYSVWLYLPRLTRDTLFTVLDLVKSKLLHEERQLDTLRRESGHAPSLSQRKLLEAQESFVDELRTFREEVARVAPLWNPQLDDGVLINFAPLWRLVPHHRAWQKECKSCWDELAAGEYKWSHLAIHLWPERVVPKCREDRSLAIAHGLEDVFWFEDQDCKWQPRPEPTEGIEDLVQARSLPAVREARESLLSADTPVTAPRRASTPRPRNPRNT